MGSQAETHQADAAAPQPQAASPDESATSHLKAMIADLKAYLSEMSAYSRYLAMLQVDRAKLASVRYAFFAVMGLLGLIVLAALLAAATCLLLLGLAGWLGQVIGSFWIGATVVGLALLVLPAVGLLAAWEVVSRRFQRQAEAKFAKFREENKSAFAGFDAKEVSGG